MDVFAYYGADWAGMCLTVASVYLLGNGPGRSMIVGFSVGFVATLLRIVFSVLSKNVPICVVNVMLAILYAKGLVFWANTNKKEKQ